MALRNENYTAEEIGVKPRTLQGWRLQRKGPKFRKIGRLVRYDDRDIKAWLDSRESGGEQLRRRLA